MIEHTWIFFCVRTLSFFIFQKLLSIFFHLLSTWKMFLIWLFFTLQVFLLLLYRFCIICRSFFLFRLCSIRRRWLFFISFKIRVHVGILITLLGNLCLALWLFFFVIMEVVLCFAFFLYFYYRFIESWGFALLIYVLICSLFCLSHYLLVLKILFSGKLSKFILLFLLLQLFFHFFYVLQLFSINLFFLI